MSNKTVTEVVKEYFPEKTDKECEFIAWEKTAFPFVDEKTFRTQLQEHRTWSDGFKKMNEKEQPQMNLTDLFNQQRKLDEEIERKHPVQPGEDRLAKRILALQVELGECANEWRGFKFWSEDQAPRVNVPVLADCPTCDGLVIDSMTNDYCNFCDASGKVVSHENNNLLEEYVDCMHFILSLGIDMGINVPEVKSENISNWDTVEQQFNYLSHTIGYLPYIAGEKTRIRYYIQIWHTFIGLGNMLGFTWKQIEQAYNDKNKTNWERQANGY